MKLNFFIARHQMVMILIVTLLVVHKFSFAQVNHAIGQAKSRVISRVDTSRTSAKKFTLKVDDVPFYMTSIQVRLDKLRYSWNFSHEDLERVLSRAVADGFNTLSIPIQWYEVEPSKDAFDWTILNEYLELCKKHRVKMELLWFGQNSYGTTGSLGSSKLNYHLRTPNYVLYSPSAGSPLTKSDYRIRRDISDYTLDLTDIALRDRETLVLAEVMKHISFWDDANGSPHVVVGVQLDNEVRGKDETNQFPDSTVIAYLSALGGAVKNSPYVVWTRINAVDVDARTRIEANFRKRRNSGTNIDFVGIDLYDYRAENMRSPVPSTFNSGNYNMVCESGAQVAQAAIFQMAALSGNVAYDHYDMLGPDGHGLYDRSGEHSFKSHGAYINDVRTVNKMLNSDLVDIATKANGKSLFVHNWAGNSKDASTGIIGIKFSPAVKKSQAISILRNSNEIILMNTNGGVFNLPGYLKIVRAEQGYYDYHNHWMSHGAVVHNQHSISPAPGSTVRLITGRRK